MPCCAGSITGLSGTSMRAGCRMRKKNPIFQGACRILAGCPAGLWRTWARSAVFVQKKNSCCRITCWCCFRVQSRNVPSWKKKLLQQAKEIRNPVLFVRGLPGQISVPAVPYHINIVNHLPTQTLQKAIGSAAFVLARTGYSSVMELMLLQKKCILIPTPGQTEQEYLARHLMQTQQALCLPQHKLRLSRALELAESFPYRLYDYENGACLRQAIDQLMADVAHHSVYRSGSNRVKS